MAQDKSEPVTQQEVAERAGVSRSVVSYVLNNGPRKVSDETRQRVLTAIKELGYHPNKHAQRLKWGSEAARNSIGVITGGLSYNVLRRSYYNHVLAGLYEGAYQHNQHIRFLSFFDALKDPVLFNKNIHRDEIASLVFILPRLILRDPENRVLFEQIMERIDNIVCLEESVYDLPAVIFDRAAAAQMAVEHLIKLGHQKIAFLAIEDERLTGYKYALLGHGLPYEESLVRVFDAAHPSASVYHITGDLLKSASPPTAIFAANDEAAISALAAVQDQGLRVPDDLAITSIDNIESACMIRPALTTVNVPRYDMGLSAIQLLMTQRDSPLPQRASMLLPIELIVRDSCGARKSGSVKDPCEP